MLTRSQQSTRTQPAGRPRLAKPRQTMAGGKRTRARLLRLLWYPPLLVIAISILFPILWMIYSSFKPQDAIFANVFALPTKVYLGDYDILFGTGGTMLRWMANSTLISFLSSAGIVVCACTIAYGLATFDFRGKQVLFFVCLLGLMVPETTVVIPGYLLISELHLVNTPWALILTYCGWSSFGVLVLRNFFESTPKDLREAAVVDGAGHWYVFTRVMLPLARPAVATVAIFGFLWVWNDFVYPLIYLTANSSFTVPLGVAQYYSRAGINIGAQMAALTIAAVVPLIVFLVFQRHFVRGLLSGAVKS